MLTVKERWENNTAIKFFKSNKLKKNQVWQWHTPELAIKYDIVKLMISVILKQNDTIKAADVKVVPNQGLK